MSTHNVGFYDDLTKLSLNYHQISPNTHLISSAELGGKINVRESLQSQLSLWLRLSRFKIYC